MNAMEMTRVSEDDESGMTTVYTASGRRFVFDTAGLKASLPYTGPALGRVLPSTVASKATEKSPFVRRGDPGPANDNKECRCRWCTPVDD